MADWKDSWISGVLLVVCLSLTPCVGDGGNCLELGFSSNLLCSSCRELKEFSLGPLEADCKRCCQAEGVASDDKVCEMSNFIVHKCSAKDFWPCVLSDSNEAWSVKVTSCAGGTCAAVCMC